MRILILSQEHLFTPGGEPPRSSSSIATSTFYLLREIASMGIFVDLVTTSSDRDSFYVPFPRITVYNLKKGDVPYIWRAHRKAKNLIRISDYDACHCFFGIPSGIVAYLNRLRVPYITSLYGYDVPRPDEEPFPFITPIIRRLLKGASTIASPIVHPKLPITDIIPNGVDIEAFFPRPHSLLRRIHLLTVGNILKRKGLEYLLVAMKELKDEFGDGFELTIAGGTKEKHTEWKLRRVVEQLGLRVKFLGHVSHSLLQPIYASSDIFVLPSLSESFSNVTLEAMACGLPVVTTNSGAAAQMVTPGNGIIVPIKDSKALASAIYNISDEDSIKRMGKESRKIAETFSWHNTASKYIALYEHLSDPQKQFPLPSTPSSIPPL